jgi:hypothetical protein
MQTTTAHAMQTTCAQVLNRVLLVMTTMLAQSMM